MHCLHHIGLCARVESVGLGRCLLIHNSGLLIQSCQCCCLAVLVLCCAVLCCAVLCCAVLCCNNAVALDAMLYVSKPMRTGSYELMHNYTTDHQDMLHWWPKYSLQSCETDALLSNSSLRHIAVLARVQTCSVLAISVIRLAAALEMSPGLLPFSPPSTNCNPHTSKGGQVRSSAKHQREVKSRTSKIGQVS